MAKKTMDDLTDFIARTLGASGPGVAGLGEDAGLGRTLGWDSLAHVNLMLSLEDWAGVAVPPELMGELTDAGAIAVWLRGQGVMAS